MDFKVSRKETRLQPSGPAEVLVDNIFDLYPVYDDNNPNLIKDVEMLDDERAELLDRAMFAIVKQRGQDPLDLTSGIQWSEYLLGEIASRVIFVQVSDAVSAEGPGVRVTTETLTKNGKQYAAFKVDLTNAV